MCTVEAWLRGKKFLSCGVFAILKGFLLSLPWLGRHLAWQVGNGENVLLGIDPIVGVSDSLMIPQGLHEYLEDLDIVTLAQARNSLPNAHKYWFTADELCVSGVWKDAWNYFTRGLETCGLRLVDQLDALTWSYKRSDGTVST